VQWVVDRTAFDEVFERPAAPRQHYQPLVSILESFTQTELDRRERLQKLSLIDQGITFTVYGAEEGIERIFPFDFVPRVIPASEWERMSGLCSGSLPSICSSSIFTASSAASGTVFSPSS
jgi:uncharacterized circularly permuted ATP-grasp superfamily protein